ncbi:MAG TPA: phosphoenolpyruvate--protein phosphotransferase, partial [Anaerolineae bacterium]
AQVAPISDGIAIGPLHPYESMTPFHTATPQLTTAPADVEWSRLQDAIKSVDQNLVKRANQLQSSGDVRAGDIFLAHRSILQDEELQALAREAITQRGMAVEAGWQDAIENIARLYRELPEKYMNQRTVDVMDVGAQVLLRLSGVELHRVELASEHSIVVAVDFTPSDVADLVGHHAGGLISLAGSANSHAAILARALGIPAVAGAAALLELDDVEGATAAIDGATGELWINPSEETVERLRQKQARRQKRRLELLQSSQQLSRTRDGRRIEIAANLSGFADARLAVEQGAEAVGVLRTEFLYLTRVNAPSEDEQVSAMRQIAGWMQGRPVIVRTLDVGGDKSLPYLALPVEANPALGVRGIRQSLLHVDVFMTQLRAILRAGVGHELRILLPMVTLVEELNKARQLIERAHVNLVSEGIEHAWPIQVGIMVELPAAALMAKPLEPYADFYSIGTNDLTQYTLAVERGNAALAQISDGLHPAVLRLVDEVVRVAHQHGKWVSVCGELAADPAAIPVLIGLGVDELSMSINAIPLAKSIVRGVDTVVAQILARKALNATSASEVRELTTSAV